VKPTIEQLGDLLALKRTERPEEGYWQDFICEFHHNQRQQAVNRSGAPTLLARLSDWFSEMGPSKWAYSAGLAYAAVTVGFFLLPRESVKENIPISPVNYQVVPAPAQPVVEQLNQLDLSPSTQGNVGEQVF
jgi:hypothetical protein